jgi:hypothetical protein
VRAAESSRLEDAAHAGDGQRELLALVQHFAEVLVVEAAIRAEVQIDDVLAEGRAQPTRRGAAAVGVRQTGWTFAQQGMFETTRLANAQTEHDGGFPELQFTGDHPGEQLCPPLLPGAHPDPLPLPHRRTKSQIASGRTDSLSVHTRQ